MRILLDTCEFLWLITGDAKLTARVESAVRDAQNQVFLSVVSFWEISLKHSLGKLSLPQPPAQFVPLQRDRHLIAPLVLQEAAVARLGATRATGRPSETTSTSSPTATQRRISGHWPGTP